MTDPRMISGRRSAPVKGNWLAGVTDAAATASGIVVVVETSVKGRADAAAAAAFAAVVEVVVGATVVVVVVGATVVVVVVGATVVVVVVLGLAPPVVVVVGMHESRCRRIPSTDFHGAGPRSASACTVPQKFGTSTESVPDVPVTAPTNGFPASCGSLTQSIHWQPTVDFGHTGVGIRSWRACCALLYVRYGEEGLGALHAAPALTRAEPSATSARAATATARYNPLIRCALTTAPTFPCPHRRLQAIAPTTSDISRQLW